jgi:hypothetical protein
MNAPESVILSRTMEPKQRKLRLICSDGVIRPSPLGTVLLPADVAQKRMESFWQGILPPKPEKLPRLVELTVTFCNMATLPYRVVHNGVVKGQELLGWMRDPPVLPAGQTADEALRQCFSVLSARGFDALQVPLPEGREHFGLVPLSFQQIESSGQTLDMKRSSHGCFGYRWVWHSLSPDEQQTVFGRNLAPA